LKKLLWVIISCILVVGLVYASTTTSVVYNVLSHFIEETEISNNISTNSWYYNQLNVNEQNVYKRLTTAINNFSNKVVFYNRRKA